MLIEPFVVTIYLGSVDFFGSYTLSVKLAYYLCIDRSFYTNKTTVVERSDKKMEVQVQFALPEDLEITEIEMIDEVFTITAYSMLKHPRCPLCGTPAQRFHRSYIRRMTDLPSSGMRVCLRVLVRKCFCDVNTCERKIFAERFTPFV